MSSYPDHHFTPAAQAPVLLSDDEVRFFEAGFSSLEDSVLQRFVTNGQIELDRRYFERSEAVTEAA